VSARETLIEGAPPCAPTYYDLDRLVERRIGRGGPPVLLLHGWGGGLRSLDAIGEPIAQHREVWSMALPGFEGSPEPSEPWGTRDYVEVVNAWLDRRGLAGTDVIAHSFGGRIGIGLASRYPDRVGRLILIASAGLRPRRTLRTRGKIVLAKVLSRLSRVTGGKAGSWLEERRYRLGSDDWRSASTIMRGTLSRVLSEDLSKEIVKIGVPTLLVWGEDDRETPLWMGRRMAALIRGARLATIPHAGHYPFLDRRGEVLSEVWRHLELPAAW